jgi:hypothetical protein
VGLHYICTKPRKEAPRKRTWILLVQFWKRRIPFSHIWRYSVPSKGERDAIHTDACLAVLEKKIKDFCVASEEEANGGLRHLYVPWTNAQTCFLLTNLVNYLLFRSCFQSWMGEVVHLDSRFLPKPTTDMIWFGENFWKCSRKEHVAFLLVFWKKGSDPHMSIRMKWFSRKAESHSIRLCPWNFDKENERERIVIKAKNEGVFIRSYSPVQRQARFLCNFFDPPETRSMQPDAEGF